MAKAGGFLGKHRIRCLAPEGRGFTAQNDKSFATDAHGITQIKANEQVMF
jgi:hypothetical protein